MRSDIHVEELDCLTKMAPNSQEVEEEDSQQTGIKKRRFKPEIVWFNVILFVILHASFFYALYLWYTSAYTKTALFAYFLASFGGLGITAGCHRLWTHRSYKAKLPLRIFLMLMSTIAGQNDIYVWCRDHRVHHKFAETDADPHNIKRGFFFAHMGWLMCKKHPDVTDKGKTVQLEDLWADPVVRFHKMFFIPMVLLLHFYLPVMIPVWCWNETLWNSLFISYFGRYCVSLHFTWLVNSAAHKYGDQPYDTQGESRENAFVSFFGLGEGWHNYHHAFPWDYATSELGYKFNLTKVFIDFMAKIGQAYDLKTANSDVVKSRKFKSGDGTRMEDTEDNKQEFHHKSQNED